jgi:hypothetical protein
VIEVDICDHRNWGALDYLGESHHVFVARHSAPHQVGTGLCNLLYLLHRGSDIRRLGLGHGLDRNGGTASDRHAPDEYLTL